jgi:hypothetical protein
MALRLGEILLQRRLISPAQLDLALAEQRTKGGRLGEILVRRGELTSRDLKAALAEQSRSFMLAAALLVNGGVGAGTPAYLAAQGSAVSAALQTFAIGTALAIGGPVEVVSPEGVRRRLAPGDPLFEGEIIETAEGAEARVLFADGSSLAVGPRSAVILDRFVYAGDASGTEKTGAAAKALLRKLAGAATYGREIEGSNVTAGVRA